MFRENAAVDAAPSTSASQEPSDEEHARMQATLQARKRRDDLVRKREFNHLRKLRKAGTGNRPVTSLGMPRPSVFQASSSFGVQERFVTLQKINAIESTIVQSWAQAKKQPPKTQEDSRPPTATPAEPLVNPSMPEAPDDFDLDFTAMVLPTSPPPHEIQPDAVTAPTERPLGVLEHALQDAAMRFSKGDSEAATRILQGLYQDTTVANEDAALLGHALFDLYRSIGAHAPFEALALDYAQRFGRSPAEWFSLPELLHQHNAEALHRDGSAAAPHQGLEWACPSTLDAGTILALLARFDSGDTPAVLHWGALQSVQDDAGPPFSALLAYWTAHTVRMQWTGEHALLRALEQNTPQGVRNTAQQWWHLRLDVLCLLHMQAAFEELALEYCVLYEESPPSWKEALGLVAQEPSLDDYASVISTLLPLDTAPPTWQDLSCSLYGEALGKTNTALETLHDVPASASQITVDCALLWRIDFECASAIVNWAQARIANGCEIEFIQLTHLLAVLLHSVGLDTYAQLSIRRQ